MGVFWCNIYANFNILKCLFFYKHRNCTEKTKVNGYLGQLSLVTPAGLEPATN